MKSCPYCGKEYPDEATTCLVDGQPLLGHVSPVAISAAQPVDIHPAEPIPFLTFPEYQWKASDAWKCIGMIVVFDIVLSLGTHAFFSSVSLRFFLRFILHSTMFLLVAAYFARTESLSAFWKGFGLDRKPTDYVWFGLAVALILRFANHLVMHGLGRENLNYNSTPFNRTYDFLYLIPLLGAAVVEEPVYRGFLYKAFRGSYPIGVSTSLLVGWTAITHWTQFFYSPWLAIILIFFTVVQCTLRERSDSLWDCILCHFVFNASLLFVP